MSGEQKLLFGPWLSSAFFCEKVLREADGVISAIRIIDRINIVGDSDEMPPTPFQATLVIVLKSGEMRGPARVRVAPTTPSNQPMPVIEFPVYFEGDADRGVGIVAETRFAIPEAGLFWFDVQMADSTITRIPLRVVYQKNVSARTGT